MRHTLDTNDKRMSLFLILVNIRDPVNPNIVVPVKKLKIRVIDILAGVPPAILANRVLTEVVNRSIPTVDLNSRQSVQQLINGKVFSAGNYMFKVNNRNTRRRCEICSKLTIKTPERRHWCRSGVFIVNFEHTSHLLLVLLLLTLSRQMPAGLLACFCIKYSEIIKQL